MTKAMRELLAQLSTKENEAREAISNKSAEEAEKVMKDVRDIRARINALQELEEAEAFEFENSRPKGEKRDRQELEEQYKGAFLKAVRNRRLTAEEQNTVKAYSKEFYNIMHEGGVESDPDGDTSIVVPKDVQTRINKLIRQETNLAAFVRHEPVSTLSGARTLEKGARHTPFQLIGEFEEVPEVEGPKFVSLAYEVKKRGGFLPLTSELLADNDANLLRYVIDWLSKKVPATHNSLILPILDAIEAKPITKVDDIKKLKNVDIIPSIAKRATWFTNQDGYNWLDTQKDEKGNYLLQPDITREGGKLLLSRPIEVIENELWATITEESDVRAPLVFGDLEEHIVHFQRMGYELASTKVGGEAWRRDSMEMRALMRDDFRTWDDKAVVRGEIKLG